MAYEDHIETNPERFGGRPVVKGTNVPVGAVMEFLMSGHRASEIVKAVPALTEADVMAIVAFAATIALGKLREDERRGLADLDDVADGD